MKPCSCLPVKGRRERRLLIGLQEVLRRCEGESVTLYELAECFGLTVRSVERARTRILRLAKTLDPDAVFATELRFAERGHNTWAVFRFTRKRLAKALAGLDRILAA
jgi:hypothetical protein